jgi:hypothetical protein
MTMATKAIAALALAFMPALSAPASAGIPMIYQDQDTPVFRFDVPDNWAARVGFEVSADAMPEGQAPAPRIISLMPEGSDGRVWTGLWSPAGVTGLEAGIAYAKSLDAKLLENAEITASREVALPGGQARIASGTGTRLGEAVVFNIAVLALTSGRVVLAAFVGAQDARTALETDMQATLNSIQAEGR